MKQFILAGGFALLSLSVFAQKKQPAREGIRFIPRMGVNFSNVTLDDYYTPSPLSEDTRVKPGFLVGVEIETALANGVYFQPGLLFSTKGAKMDDPDGTLKLSYLEIPLNVYYKPELGEGRLLLGAGPYAAFATGGKVDYQNGSKETFRFANNKDFNDLNSNLFMRRSDFGLNISVGYEHASGVMLELRAQLGLANNATQINDAPANIWEDGKFKSTLFGLVAGYRF